MITKTGEQQQLKFLGMKITSIGKDTKYIAACRPLTR
jgi:hypothetical protein